MIRKKLLPNGKKGNAILDTLLVVVVLFVFAIIAFVGFKSFGELKDDFVANPDAHNESVDEINNLHSRYAPLFDGLFVFVLALLWMLVIIASFNIESHPIFFVVTIILLLIMLFVPPVLGNFFVDFSNDAEFFSLRSSFPMTVWIFEHFLVLGIAIGFSIVTVLFGKSYYG